MKNFTNYSSSCAPRPGLYRVWVSLHDDGCAPLICIWIDPRMTAFRPQHCEGSTPIPGTGEGMMAEEIEDSQSGIGLPATTAQLKNVPEWIS
jgi:hypothetical protein